MSSHPLSILIPFILFSIFLYKWLFSNRNLQLPPSPPKFPIIGHLHKLGKYPQHSLRALSNIYGDLMLLYLGNRPTLIVSSANAAQEIMKTHDLIFANRPNLRFINRIFYDGNDVAFSSYGEKWRVMKSICVTQLLSNKMVQSFRVIREEEVARVIAKIKGQDGLIVNLSETFLTLFRGTISRTALGMTYNGDDESSTEFYKLFKELITLMGKVSVGDYIPMLGWIDRLNGLERRVEKVHKHFDKFIELVIQQHQTRIERNHIDIDEKDDKGQGVKDFVDVLLQFQSENQELLSRDSIKAIILDMFVAGTETSSTTLEWAMTELIRHPDIMNKLQEEVKNIVKSNTRVSECDLESMKYLKAVIKETLRLHPPVPLLLFRESTKNVKIKNYDISATTQVIINAFAIQQSTDFWQHPHQFDPNRFLGNSTKNNIDLRGQHFEFIPFGAGRRSCPGVSYSMVSTELALASLVYEFKWTLPNGREGKTLDVAESTGITTGRLNPLLVIATPTAAYRCN